jgi:PKD repeat protein
MSAIGRRATSACAIAVALALGGAAPAAADTFCVPTGSCPPENQHPTLAAALVAAGGNGPGRDTILLGAYTDMTPATNSPGSPVDIVGVGDGTVLQGGGGNTTRLRLLEPTSTVSHLQVRLNANSSTGIEVGGHVHDVAVTAEPTATQTLVGVLLNGSGKLEAAGVFMPTTAGSDSTGVRAENPPTGTKTITDVTVEGETGILSAAGVGTNITVVRDAFVRARTGISANNSSVFVDNALVEIVPGASGVGLNALASVASASLRARHVTVVRPGDSSQGEGISSTDVDGSDAFPSTVEVSNSVISGFLFDVRRSGAGDLKIDWSRFATTGITQPTGSNNTSAEPSFVNPGTRDFRLAAASPLIDAGDPAPLASDEPVKDLNRFSRPLDGNGDCAVRRDMGAFEFQPPQRAPLNATAAAAPASAAAAEAVSFSASACDPDGDALTYSWSFDDGTAATGATVSKAFATGGTHTGTVTVSDPGGRTASAAATVQVAAPIVPPPPPPTGAVILSFSLLRTTFAVDSAPTATSAAKKPKRGSAFRFALSDAADVTITIHSLTPGRVSKGRCVKPSRKLRRAKRCTRATRKGVLRRAGAAGANNVPFSGRIGTKALRPGRYRATLGTPGAKSRTARFKIVKAR